MLPCSNEDLATYKISSKLEKVHMIGGSVLIQVHISGEKVRGVLHPNARLPMS